MRTGLRQIYELLSIRCVRKIRNKKGEGQLCFLKRSQ